LPHHTKRERVKEKVRTKTGGGVNGKFKARQAFAAAIALSACFDNRLPKSHGFLPFLHSVLAIRASPDW